MNLIEVADCPVVYLVRHISSGMIKIGRTDNWERRSKELEVDITTERLHLVQLETTEEAQYIEQRAHRLLREHRLVQSEWFHVTFDVAMAALISGMFSEMTRFDGWTEKERHLLIRIGNGINSEMRKRLREQNSPSVPLVSHPMGT